MMIYKKIPNEADTSIQYTDIREDDTEVNYMGALDMYIEELAMTMSLKELEQYLSHKLHAKVLIKPNKNKGAK